MKFSKYFDLQLRHHLYSLYIASDERKKLVTAPVCRCAALNWSFHHSAVGKHLMIYTGFSWSLVSFEAFKCGKRFMSLSGKVKPPVVSIAFFGNSNQSKWKRLVWKIHVTAFEPMQHHSKYHCCHILLLLKCNLKFQQIQDGIVHPKTSILS